MERMLRVQTVKGAGPGFNSMSPERRRKARRERRGFSVVFLVCSGQLS